MTRANALRAYIEAHPNQTGRQIAEALGVERHACTNHLANMARRGTLTATGERLERTYTIGRALLKDWALPAEEADARARKRRREYGRRVRAARGPRIRQPKPIARIYSVTAAPVSISAESSDEFIARGGRVEVLPGFAYVMPSHMPVGARYGVAG